VNLVTASNVYTSNGMAAFWPWLFDIAKTKYQLPQSCHIGHCWQLYGSVDDHCCSVAMKLLALVIAGNYVAIWMNHYHLVAMKLLALVIAGNYVAMWMHHCHLVVMKLLALVIAGNYVAMTFKVASEAVEAAQS
jgi:hypothetical protein